MKMEIENRNKKTGKHPSLVNPATNICFVHINLCWNNDEILDFYLKKED